MASEFESWLSERLTQFNADGDVFSSYILGILDSEETQDEKQDNLCDLLEGLGLDDGQVDPCERLKKEIWSKWSSVKDPSVEDQKAKEKPLKATDLGATLAAHAESQTKAFKQSKGTNLTKLSTVCENFRIFLLLRFYVKSIFENLEVLKLPFLPF